MSKVYVVCKGLSRWDKDNIKVTTSKAKAIKIALLYSTEYTSCDILEKDTTECDADLNQADLTNRCWDITVGHHKIISAGEPYFCPLCKEIEIIRSIFTDGFIVRYIKAETREEAIKIAKNVVKDHVKQAFRNWADGGYLEVEE